MSKITITVQAKVQEAEKKLESFRNSVLQTEKTLDESRKKSANLQKGILGIESSIIKKREEQAKKLESLDLQIEKTKVSSLEKGAKAEQLAIEKSERKIYKIRSDKNIKMLSLLKQKKSQEKKVIDESIKSENNYLVHLKENIAKEEALLTRRKQIYDDVANEINKIKNTQSKPKIQATSLAKSTEQQKLSEYYSKLELESDKKLDSQKLKEYVNYIDSENELHKKSIKNLSNTIQKRLELETKVNSHINKIRSQLSQHKIQATSITKSKELEQLSDKYSEIERLDEVNLNKRLEKLRDFDDKEARDRKNTFDNLKSDIISRSKEKSDLELSEKIKSNEVYDREEKNRRKLELSDLKKHITKKYATEDEIREKAISIRDKRISAIKKERLALDKENEAEKKNTKELQKNKTARRETFEETYILTSAEKKYRKELSLLDKDLKDGVISATEYNSAKKKVNSELQENTRKLKINTKTKQQAFKETYEMTRAEVHHKNVLKEINLLLAEGTISQKQYNSAKKKADLELKNSTKSYNNLTNSVVRHLRQIETLVIALYTLKKGYDLTIGMGIKTSKMLESQTYGISALVSANTKMVDSNGNAVNSMEKFVKGQEYAKKVMHELRIESLKVPATFGQLTELFQQAEGQILSMGDSFGTSIDDIHKNGIKFVSRMSNLASSVGMPMDRVREEIRSMLSANATTDSLLATMLFGSPTEANKAIRKARESGKNGMKNLLDDMLEPFDVLAETRTFEKGFLQMQGAWEITMQSMVEKSGAFKDITDAFYNMADNIKGNQQGIIDGFDKIYNSAKNVADLISHLAVPASFAIGVYALTGAYNALTLAMKANPMVLIATTVISATLLAKEYLDDFAKRQSEIRFASKKDIKELSETEERNHKLQMLHLDIEQRKRSIINLERINANIESIEFQKKALKEKEELYKKYASGELEFEEVRAKKIGELLLKNVVNKKVMSDIAKFTAKEEDKLVKLEKQKKEWLEEQVRLKKELLKNENQDKTSKAFIGDNLKKVNLGIDATQKAIEEEKYKRLQKEVKEQFKIKKLKLSILNLDKELQGEVEDKQASLQLEVDENLTLWELTKKRGFTEEARFKAEVEYKKSLKKLGADGESEKNNNKDYLDALKKRNEALRSAITFEKNIGLNRKQILNREIEELKDKLALEEDGTKNLLLQAEIIKKTTELKGIKEKQLKEIEMKHWEDTLASSTESAIVSALESGDVLGALKGLGASIGSSMIQASTANLISGVKFGDNKTSGFFSMDSLGSMGGLGGMAVGLGTTMVLDALFQQTKSAEELEAESDNAIQEQTDAIVGAIDSQTKLLDSLGMLSASQDTKLESAYETFIGDIKDFSSFQYTTKNSSFSKLFGGSTSSTSIELDLTSIDDLVSFLESGQAVYDSPFMDERYNESSGYDLVGYKSLDSFLEDSRYSIDVEQLETDVNDYLSALISVNDTYKSLSSDLKDIYDSMNDDYYSKKKLEEANKDLEILQTSHNTKAFTNDILSNTGKRDVDYGSIDYIDLSTSSGFSDFLSTTIDDIDSFTSKIDDLGTSVASDDLLEKTKALQDISDTLDVDFLNVDEAMDYIDSLKLVGEAYAEEEQNNTDVLDRRKELLLKKEEIGLSDDELRKLELERDIAEETDNYNKILLREIDTKERQAEIDKINADLTDELNRLGLDENELRKLELETMDESSQVIQEMIWAREDELQLAEDIKEKYRENIDIINDDINKQYDDFIELSNAFDDASNSINNYIDELSKIPMAYADIASNLSMEVMKAGSVQTIDDVVSSEDSIKTFYDDASSAISTYYDYLATESDERISRLEELNSSDIDALQEEIDSRQELIDSNNEIVEAYREYADSLRLSILEDTYSTQTLYRLMNDSFNARDDEATTYASSYLSSYSATTASNADIAFEKALIANQFSSLATQEDDATLSDLQAELDRLSSLTFDNTAELEDYKNKELYELDKLKRDTINALEVLDSSTGEIAPKFDDTISGLQEQVYDYLGEDSLMMEYLKQISENTSQTFDDYLAEKELDDAKTETTSAVNYLALYPQVAEHYADAPDGSNVASLKEGGMSLLEYAKYNYDNYGVFEGREFADGGIVTRPTLGMIGEAGYPEAVIPLKNPNDPLQMGEVVAKLSDVVAELKSLKKEMSYIKASNSNIDKNTKQSRFAS